MALAVSLLLYFLAGSLVHRVELGVRGGIVVPSLGVLLGTTAWVLLVFAAIRTTLARGFRLATESTLAASAALAWPITVALAGYATLVLVMTLFPEAGVAAAGVLDSGYLNMPDTWTFPIIWTHAVNTASALPVLALFVWALFNVLRSAFGFTRPRAAVATAVATIAAFLVTLLFWSLTGQITRQIYYWTEVA